MTYDLHLGPKRFRVVETITSPASAADHDPEGDATAAELAAMPKTRTTRDVVASFADRAAAEADVVARRADCIKEWEADPQLRGVPVVPAATSVTWGPTTVAWTIEDSADDPPRVPTTGPTITVGGRELPVGTIAECTAARAALRAALDVAGVHDVWMDHGAWVWDAGADPARYPTADAAREGYADAVFDAVLAAAERRAGVQS